MRDRSAEWAADTGAGFVGRARELGLLQAALQATAGGQGRLVMLVGEAGIGKTCTAAEFARQASDSGALVLRGACYDGEWAPPFGPFAEAITTYARHADTAELRTDLSFGAAPIARVIPAVRERLPDVPEPTPLQPDEERLRLFDAISQFLIATAREQSRYRMIAKKGGAMVSVRRTILTLVAMLAWAGTGGATLTPTQKCEKTKNRAAAKYGQCIATQRGKEIGGKVPDFLSCATTLTDAFSKAEQKAIDAGSACSTTGNTAAILARTDSTFNPTEALPKWFSNTRFVDNGDGTVSDTLTGLMWERKTGTIGSAVACDRLTCPADNQFSGTYSTSLPLPARSRSR